MNSSARSGREDKAFCKEVSSHFLSESFNSSNFFLSYIRISFGNGKIILCNVSLRVFEREAISSFAGRLPRSPWGGSLAMTLENGILASCLVLKLMLTPVTISPLTQLASQVSEFFIFKPFKISAQLL